MELPFNFVAKTTAKAAQVMANFNALKNAVSAIEATLSSGVTKVAAGAINRAQMAAGYDHRLALIDQGVYVLEGRQDSDLITTPHHLGEAAASADGSLVTAAGYEITFDVRIIALDATNVTFQLIGSTPAPGTVLILVKLRVWS